MKSVNGRFLYIFVCPFLAHNKCNAGGFYHCTRAVVRIRQLIFNKLIANNEHKYNGNMAIQNIGIDKKIVIKLNNNNKTFIYKKQDQVVQFWKI